MFRDELRRTTKTVALLSAPRCSGASSSEHADAPGAGGVAEVDCEGCQSRIATQEPRAHPSLFVCSLQRDVKPAVFNGCAKGERERTTPWRGTCPAKDTHPPRAAPL